MVAQIAAATASRKDQLRRLACATTKATTFCTNGVPRTFRDTRATVYEAARYAKSKAKGDIIEIVDCSTGTKLVMLEGRPDRLSGGAKRDLPRLVCHAGIRLMFRLPHSLHFIRRGANRLHG